MNYFCPYHTQKKSVYECSTYQLHAQTVLTSPSSHYGTTDTNHWASRNITLNSS